MSDDIKYVLKEDRDIDLSLKTISDIIFSNWVKIVAVGVVVGAMAFTYNFLLSPYYDSSSMLASTMFDGTEIMPILDPISEAVDDGNVVELRKNLRLSKEVIESIKALQFVSQGYDEDLFTCQVNVQVTDTNSIPLIEAAILDALQSNPYFQERYRSKQEQWTSVYDKTVEEIGNLNKMKVAIDDIDAKVQAGLIVYPLNIHSELVHMEEKAASIKWRRDMLSIAYYLRTATMPSTKSGPSVVKNSIAAVIAAVFGAILFFILRYAIVAGSKD